MIEKIKLFFKKNSNIKTKSKCNINELFESLGGNVISFEIGEDIVNLHDCIFEKIKEIREKQANLNGFIFPEICIIDNLDLQENEMIIKVREKEIQQLFVIPNVDSLKNETEIIMKKIYDEYLDEIFTFELTETYLSHINNKMTLTLFHIRIMYSINEIREILIELLKNGKSIKNIYYIFEKIAIHSLSSGFYTHNAPRKIANNISLDI